MYKVTSNRNVTMDHINEIKKKYIKIILASIISSTDLLVPLDYFY